MESDIPWKAGTVDQRLDDMRKRLKGLRSAYATKKDYEYAEMVGVFYSLLRATWERAVEDIAFVGTVRRFRDHIAVNKYFKKVSVIDGTDCDVLVQAHKKCCDITLAHDPSPVRNAPIPSPDEISTDIEVLADWVKGIKGKQKALGLD